MHVLTVCRCNQWLCSHGCVLTVTLVAEHSPDKRHLSGMVPPT
jgi:hypothetical protein